MKKPNITEGEWEINEEGTVYHWGNGPETDGYRPCIARVSQWKGTGNGSPTSEAKANAKAISAVPKMVDALIDSNNALWEAYRKIGDHELEQWFDDVMFANKQALKKAGVKIEEEV